MASTTTVENTKRDIQRLTLQLGLGVTILSENEQSVKNVDEL